MVVSHFWNPTCPTCGKPYYGYGYTTSCHCYDAIQVVPNAQPWVTGPSVPPEPMFVSKKTYDELREQHVSLTQDHEELRRRYEGLRDAAAAWLSAEAESDRLKYEVAHLV